MMGWLTQLRARIGRWLYGDPNPGLPDKIREASHRVMNESSALHALIERMKREEQWKS
jgi:hypothetical protein